MTDYFVIDAHVHTYKTPEIGRQALSGFDMSGCCGTPEELVPIMRQAGISLAIQCNMTPARSMFEAAVAGLPPDRLETDRSAIIGKLTDRVRRRNEWTCQSAREYVELVPFLSVDPIMGREAMMAELEDKIDNHGARGLKVHPGEGHFFPDDPAMMPVWEMLAQRGLPAISHSGPDIANPNPDYTRPRAFASILERFPGLNLVMAHLGGGYYDEVIEIAGRYPNAYFDTSASLPGDKDGRPLLLRSKSLTDEEAVELIRRIGVDRVLFGTDYPWFHPGQDLKRFLGLGFSEEEKQALLGGNARRLFNL
ncbi:MAG: amidohydrolase family protein [Proteobacteria bacterium]|nr:amidohydrolase family protein [Pseudomonadota bacterium]